MTKWLWLLAYVYCVTAVSVCVATYNFNVHRTQTHRVVGSFLCGLLWPVVAVAAFRYASKASA